MYRIPHYTESDPDVLEAFMREHSFATLMAVDAAGKPVATQVPLMVQRSGGRFRLTGHIMRNTDHHKALVHSGEARCLFTGPHAYVSATWYEDPHGASTWNYMTVQAFGAVRILREEALIDILRETTLHYENGATDSTAIYDNLSDDYRLPLLKAIVGFEIEVSSIEGIFKLSQNRDSRSLQNIIEALEKRSPEDRELAAQMEVRRKLLFEKPDN